MNWLHRVKTADVNAQIQAILALSPEEAKQRLDELIESMGGPDAAAQLFAGPDKQAADENWGEGFAGKWKKHILCALLAATLGITYRDATIGTNAKIWDLYRHQETGQLTHDPFAWEDSHLQPREHDRRLINPQHIEKPEAVVPADVSTVISPHVLRPKAGPALR